MLYASRAIRHTATATGCAFHPLERDVCATRSRDRSVRVWDLSGRGKKQFKKLVNKKALVKAKDQKGRRTRVACKVYHPDGRTLAIGTKCGSV